MVLAVDMPGPGNQPAAVECHLADLDMNLFAPEKCPVALANRLAVLVATPAGS